MNQYIVRAPSSRYITWLFDKLYLTGIREKFDPRIPQLGAVHYIGACNDRFVRGIPEFSRISPEGHRYSADAMLWFMLGDAYETSAPSGCQHCS